MKPSLSKRLLADRASWHVQVVTAGANPVSVKKGIDKTCEHLLIKLKENAVPVKGSQDIKVGHVTLFGH